MNEVINSSAASSILNTKSIDELNSKVNELFKENPFIVVPAGFTANTAKELYSKIDDRLNVKIEQFVPNLNDLETMTVAVIGLAPVVGPMMQGIFTMMSTKVKGTQRQEIITKETINNMIDIEMANYKKEFIQTINERIEKSKVDQQVKIVEKAFNGLKDSHLELLYESLTHLKVRLLNKDIPSKNDPLLTGIRSKFDSLRTNLKMLLSVVLNKEILLYVPKLATQIMVLYILILNDLNNHWYQYGFDPQYALGTPADDEEPATHSYKEKLHLNIQRYFKAMLSPKNYILYKQAEVEVREHHLNLLDFKEADEIHDIKTFLSNVPLDDWLLKGVNVIFESDPILYPIPLVKLNVDQATDEVETIKIKTSEKKGPTIYRIDSKAISLLYNAESSEEIDPATGCSGSSGYCVGIELDEKKYIRLRWFYRYPKEYPQVALEYALLTSEDISSLKSQQLEPTYQYITNSEEAYGTLLTNDKLYNYSLYQEDRTEPNISYCFFTSTKTNEKKDKFLLKSEFKLTSKDDDGNSKYESAIFSRFYFVEVIVSDE